MKRILALAAAVCMTLSMMMLTASAVEWPTTLHAGCEHTDSDHIYASGNTFPDGERCIEGRKFYVDGSYKDFTEATKYDNGVIKAKFFPAYVAPSTTIPGGWYYKVKGVTPSQYLPCIVTAPAQPKTGVEDTLPLWFGIMAVSACAYVLTSKKKIF